jgi:hypothetical protein
MPFNKVEGCNKMTCSCGLTQCYLCRESAIDYNHFCEYVLTQLPNTVRPFSGTEASEAQTDVATTKNAPKSACSSEIRSISTRVASRKYSVGSPRTSALVSEFSAISRTRICLAEELRVHGPIGGNAPPIVRLEDRPAAILAPPIVRPEIAGRPVAAQVAPFAAVDVPRLPFV